MFHRQRRFWNAKVQNAIKEELWKEHRPTNQECLDERLGVGLCQLSPEQNEYQ